VLSTQRRKLEGKGVDVIKFGDELLLPIDTEYLKNKFSKPQQEELSLLL